MAQTSFLTYVKTSRVKDGDMSLISCGEAQEHRRSYFESEHLSIEQGVFMMVPRPNGTTIAEVDLAARGHTITADALLTRDAGLVLALLTADCLPIIVSDEERGIIALAHCGWESTHLHLPQILLERFSALGSEPSQLRVRIGPGIHANSYWQTREKVRQIHDPAWKPFLREDNIGRIGIDVQGYVTSQCREKGVRDIVVDPADTYRDPQYFSHRRAEETSGHDGRMVTLAWLESGSHETRMRVQ